MNKKIIRLSAVTALFICLILGAVSVLQTSEDGVKPETSLDTIIANEIKLTDHLNAIITAQTRYHKTDWNKDGINHYAQFIVHLWQTVDNNANPVKTRFIPKDLAFAMGRSRAVDGYYFESIRTKAPGSPENENQSSESIAMDSKTEWAVKAVPVDYGRSGVYTYMVSQSGNIIAKKVRYGEAASFPENSEISGWVEINAASDIWEMHTNKPIE